MIGQAEPAPLIPFPEPETEEPPEQESLFNASPAVQDYKLPDRNVLRKSGTNGAAPAEASGQVAHALVQALADFGVQASVGGQIVGPRVTRYELQLAPGHEDVQGLRAQGRPLLRAGDDRDPHPRADPRQAGGRRRGPEPHPEPRHARRHLRRPPADGEPGRGLARQGHLRKRRLDRPRPHAAPAHRRHDRLRKVGLHQHDPDLGAPARDPRRGAHDPDRPEADRAQLLRADPAPPGAGRLEPEGSDRRARKRDRRDGAALRAPRARSGRATCRRRTAPSASAASSRSRTCSS